jgi:hypothetical protein
MLRSTIEGLISNLPSLKKPIVAFLEASTSAGVTNVASQMVDRFTSEAVVWLERFRPFLDSSETGAASSLNFIPPEIFLIVPAINKKVKLGTATPMELVASAFLQDIQALFSIDSKPESQPEPAPSSPSLITLQGFSAADVEHKLKLLAAALPDLSDPDIFFSVLEVPVMAQHAIRSVLTASQQDPNKVC